MRTPAGDCVAVPAENVLGQDAAILVEALRRNVLPHQQAEAIMDEALPLMTPDQSTIVGVQEILARLLPEVSNEEILVARFRAEFVKLCRDNLIAKETVRKVLGQYVDMDRAAAVLKVLVRDALDEARQSIERSRSGVIDFRMRVPQGFHREVPWCPWREGTVVAARVVRVEPDMTPTDAVLTLCRGDTFSTRHELGLRLLRHNWPQPDTMGLPSSCNIANIESPRKGDYIGSRPPCEIKVLSLPDKRLSKLKVFPDHPIPKHHALYVLGLARHPESKAA